jgi:hypothetical protein
MLSGKQEVTLDRKTPLAVSRSEDTDPKQQGDRNSSANEVPFLITASELRDRKIKRRKKHNAPRP